MPNMIVNNKIDVKKVKSIYEFSEEDGNGNTMHLDYYKGNCIFVVNVNTRDKKSLKIFQTLSKLYKKYHKETNGLSMLIFPCYQFGVQEKGNEIYDLCERHDLDIGDIYNEVEVNGSGASPLYQYLKFKMPGHCGGFINSNFTIFAIDKFGQPVERLSASVNPDVLEELIEHQLAL